MEFDNNLANAYQQSVNILSSLVDNLLTAGIIDLEDSSYTVLKDMTGKTVMNARHPYEDFFCTWMKLFLLEENEEGLRFSSLPYLKTKLKEKKKVSQEQPGRRNGKRLFRDWRMSTIPFC